MSAHTSESILERLYTIWAHIYTFVDNGDLLAAFKENAEAKKLLWADAATLPPDEKKKMSEDLRAFVGFFEEYDNYGVSNPEKMLHHCCKRKVKKVSPEQKARLAVYIQRLGAAQATSIPGPSTARTPIATSSTKIGPLAPSPVIGAELVKTRAAEGVKLPELVPASSHVTEDANALPAAPTFLSAIQSRVPFSQCCQYHMHCFF
ncbi:hypothetical protein BDN70DRAFT_939103 [Pholiota conissans]|uniref:Uncharacterized protein n=1 Tax=Pholiota conissans TaxID=109636 RepID=A0A9P6CT50_9AGAR|nr:hypothetical protein BDN70DRAFT_939103 [Pholiota conissans]